MSGNGGCALGGSGEDIARCSNADRHGWQCPEVNGLEVIVIMPGTSYYVVNTCYDLVE